MEAVVGWGAMDLYPYGSFSFPTLTYSKYSAPPSGFTAVWNAIVPLESSVLVNTGAPSKGLYVAVTVTSLVGTLNDVSFVLGLVSVIPSAVHSLKGMTSPLLLFLS